MAPTDSTAPSTKKNNRLIVLPFLLLKSDRPALKRPASKSHKESKLNGNVRVVTATWRILLEGTYKTAVLDLATVTLLAHRPCKAMACNHCTNNATMFHENSTTEHMCLMCF